MDDLPLRVLSEYSYIVFFVPFQIDDLHSDLDSSLLGVTLLLYYIFGFIH